MPLLKTSHLPPPQDWSEFEALCCDLWKVIWQDPHAQRVGRSGQSQHGVDIFGYPQRGQAIAGVQCKLKSSWRGQYLTQQEVEEAVAKAQSFQPPLSHLTIATTAPRDESLQKSMRLVSERNLQEGTFSVTIAFWEDIQTELVEHDSLLRAYYPQLLTLSWSSAEGSASVGDLEDYLDRFQQFFTEDLPPLVHFRLVQNETEVLPEDLKEELRKHNVLHFQGPSGAGKTHLAKHFALDLAREQLVPIFAPARYYDGKLSTLLNRSIAHLTTTPSEDLIARCDHRGVASVVIVDGFNECPERLRSDLAQDLLSLRLRFSVKVVVTSRPEAACDSILKGNVYRLGVLDPAQKERFLSHYGTLTGEIVDILRTPLDIRIAAESAGKVPADSPTLYDLFHAYARDRLTPEPDSSFLVLTELASLMAERLTSAISETEFHRLNQLLAGEEGRKVLEGLKASGLLSFSQGYCSLWHEKLQRFFQAESLLLKSAGSAEKLAQQLRLPINEDVAEFVLGGLRDIPSLQACLSAIRSEELLLSILRGELGNATRAALEAALFSLLERARHELKQIKVSIEIGGFSQKLATAKSDVPWTESDYRLMHVLGRAFAKGFFCEEVLELVEATERECLSQLAELPSRIAWSYLFPYLYIFMGSGMLPASRIIHAARLGIDNRWSSQTKQVLASRTQDLEKQSPGSLFLLGLLFKDVIFGDDDLDLLTRLPAFLRICWDTRLRHIRLEAAELAGYAEWKLKEPLRSEVEALLETFPSNDPFLNSTVFESLANYCDLGIASEDQARSELQQVLDGPRDEEAYRQAAHLFDNQFEDVLQGHYSQAVQDLQGKDSLDFHIMAARGMDSADSFFLDLVLQRLIRAADPEARCAFEKWTCLPSPESVNPDQSAGVFLLSHIGLAQISETLPDFAPPTNDDESSWRAWGEIIFWLHKPNTPEVVVRTASSPFWKQLIKRPSRAAVDPWLHMEVYVRTHTWSSVYKPIAEFFPGESKNLLERGLISPDLVSLVDAHPGSTDRRIDG